MTKTIKDGQQFIDAYLIMRESLYSIRCVGTAHAKAIAEQSCRELADASFNTGTGNEYRAQANTRKYYFDHVGRVIGLVAAKGGR